MKTIILTKLNQKPVWIMIDNITHFSSYQSNHGVGTEISFSGCDNIFVKEPPERVGYLIEQKDKVNNNE